MAQLIDTIMANLPIAFLVIIFICLIYSEFTGICISWDKFMEIVSGVIVGHQVKVLG